MKETEQNYSELTGNNDFAPLRKVSLFDAESLFLMKVTFKNANPIKILVSAENYGEAKELTQTYFQQLNNGSQLTSVIGNQINYDYGLKEKTDE
jgi:hypothetical protein